MQPRVLVLDEPVAGLDPVGRSEILALIKKLQKEISPTVITVSHNMDDMAAMADRIIALKDGEIVADGSPKRVFCNRRLIAEAGLDLPAATRITDTLKARGIDLPSDIVTMDELARELEKLRKRGLLKAERSAESDYFGKAEQDDLSELSGEDDDV